MIRWPDRSAGSKCTVQTIAPDPRSSRRAPRMSGKPGQAEEVGRPSAWPDRWVMVRPPSLRWMTWCGSQPAAGLDSAGTGYISTGGADDAGQSGSGPWQAVLPGGAGSRSAGAPCRRDRRRPGGAVLRRQPRAFLRRGRRAVRDAERSLVAGAVRVRVHASPPGPARSARAAGPRTRPDQPRPPPDRRRRRAGPGGVCRGWSAAAQAGARPPSPVAGGAGSHGVPRRLRSAGRGSRSPGGHDRVDEALDTAQSERPQRALSSPRARHRVRPAAGGRGSPRPVEAARRDVRILPDAG